MLSNRRLLSLKKTNLPRPSRIACDSPAPVERMQRARREAKAAYDGNCHVKSYFVPNALMALNPPDKVIRHIDALVSRISANNHRAVNGMINVEYGFHEKFLGSKEYSAALRWLSENGIIVRSKCYSTGMENKDPFAKPIKISDEAVLSGFSEVKLRAKTDKLQTNCRQTADKLQTNCRTTNRSGIE
jgi:hypothetical protein